MNHSQTAFDFKGSMLTLTMLHLNTTKLDQIGSELLARVSQAPDMFNSLPTVVRLDGLPENIRINFRSLGKLLKDNGLVPVGIQGGSERQRESAAKAGWGLLAEGRSQTDSPVTPRPTTKPEPAPAPPQPLAVLETRYITQPIRSGQQVHSKGDLVVVAPVNAGSELLAEGSIHVYGPLRGRALAGISGNVRARIFCLNLAAELVSIAGNYQLMEHLGGANMGRAVQIRLDGEKLIIDPL